jgi:hypothetical protein
MMKRHFLLFGILISLCLLMIAALVYPGGSQQDSHSTGFDWRQNYISNLFSPQAMNGADNSSRVWAITGWALLCITVAIFFFDFSKKIPSVGPARIIRYGGIAGMFFGIQVATPLHDSMVTVSGILMLVSLFYIAVFVFKSRLTLLKILAIIVIVLFEVCNYLYYTRSRLDLLPVAQKTTLLAGLVWILSLQYFTKREDFEWKSRSGQRASLDEK